MMFSCVFLLIWGMYSGLVSGNYCNDTFTFLSPTRDDTPIRTQAFNVSWMLNKEEIKPERLLMWLLDEQDESPWIDARSFPYDENSALVIMPSNMRCSEDAYYHFELWSESCSEREETIRSEEFQISCDSSITVVFDETSVRRGSTVQILFSTIGVIVGVHINLRTATSALTIVSDYEISNNQNNHKYSWEVDGNVIESGSGYYLEVISSDYDTVYQSEVRGYSSNFTITSSPSDITILSPALGSTVVRSYTYDILWTSVGNISAVDITLIAFDSGDVVSVLTDLTPNTGGFQWIVDSYLDSSITYKIVMSPVVYAPDQDWFISESDEFDIVPLDGSITIAQPTVGTVWTYGLGEIIVLNTVGDISNINMSLCCYTEDTSSFSLDNIECALIFPVAPNNNVFMFFGWSDITFINADEVMCYISVVPVTYDPAMDPFVSISSEFAVHIGNGSIVITEPTIDNSTLESPVWTRAETYEIQWQVDGLSEILIEICEDKGCEEIAEYTVSTNDPVLPTSVSYMVPTDADVSLTYWVKISSMQGDNYVSTSEVVLIKAKETIISPISPATDSKWVRGESYDVSFFTAGAPGVIYTVKVELCSTTNNYENITVEAELNDIEVVDSYALTTLNVPVRLEPSSPVTAEYFVVFTSTSWEAGADTFVTTRDVIVIVQYSALVIANEDMFFWYRGSENTLEWNTEGNISSVNVFMCEGETQDRCDQIGENVPVSDSADDTTSVFTWNIPAKHETGIHNVYLSANTFDPAAEYVESAPVTFALNASISLLQLNAPVVDARWERGGEHTIAWDTQGNISTVDLWIHGADLPYDSGYFIAENVKNVESYAWKIPDTTPLHFYVIHILAHTYDPAERQVSGISGSFQILDYEKHESPYLTLFEGVVACIVIVSVLLCLQYHVEIKGAIIRCVNKTKYESYDAFDSNAFEMDDTNVDGDLHDDDDIELSAIHAMEEKTRSRRSSSYVPPPLSLESTNVIPLSPEEDTEILI